MRMHLTMDTVAGIFLAISPWLFGFYKQGANAWLPHLIVGIVYAGANRGVEAQVARAYLANINPSTSGGWFRSSGRQSRERGGIFQRTDFSAASFNPSG